MNYRVSPRKPVKRRFSLPRPNASLARIKPLSVMLATGNGIAREGLRSIIEQCGFRVFDCQATEQEFIFDASVANKCQIFVIDASDDIEYNRMTDFAALIRERNEIGHIVVLVPPHLAQAFDTKIIADASAIATLDVTVCALEILLHLVSQNYVIRSANVSVATNPDRIRVTSQVISTPIQSPNQLPVTGDLRVKLSTREKEIILYVMQGSPNKVIARALGIAEATVKIHMKGIFRKIGVANRTQAASYALNHGWFGGEDMSPQEFEPTPACLTVSAV